METHSISECLHFSFGSSTFSDCISAYSTAYFVIFSAPQVEEGKLNAASPEFIPRSLQGGAPQDMVGGAPPNEWEEGETTAAGDNQSGEWHDGMLFLQ